MQSKKHVFTLIELLVVIAIIAILAAKPVCAVKAPTARAISASWGQPWLNMQTLMMTGFPPITAVSVFGTPSVRGIRLTGSNPEVLPVFQKRTVPEKQAVGNSRC